MVGQRVSAGLCGRAKCGSVPGVTSFAGALKLGRQCALTKEEAHLLVHARLSLAEETVGASRAR